MKRLSILFVFAVIAALAGCGDAAVKGTAIRGTFQNAGNLQVYFDKVVLNSANEVISKVDADGQGNFEFSFPEGVEAGIYRVRVGAKSVGLVLDGKEKVVAINADMNTLTGFNAQVEGSAATSSYLNTMTALTSRQVSADDLKKVADTTANPLGAMFVLLQAVGSNAGFLDLHKSTLARVTTDYPNSVYATNYGAFITQVESAYAQQQATELIKVGMDAPDIKLPSPDGKEYSLSSLKGKVVLLDFWASWCGPCRRENPNVVQVYNKYKDKGFTVYSVSLDGLDSRSRSRLTSQQQIDDQLKQSKQRWIEAIAKDGLPWEYHVSDLKKWECAPAQLYGVNSIPRTFLIDRDGKIAAVNLRGAANIEAELQKLL